MELRLRRTERAEGWTMGELWVDGTKECDTIEDKDRGLTSAMKEEEIRARKVRGETAIPTGEYEVRLDVLSNKYRKSPYMQEVCGGKVPRLEGVPGFDGILIHTGNTAKDTEGCIIVGSADDGRVSASRDAFRRLYKKLRGAEGRITIKIE